MNVRMNEKLADVETTPLKTAFASLTVEVPIDCIQPLKVIPRSLKESKRPATSPVPSHQQLLRYAPVLTGASTWARRHSGGGIWSHGATAA
jgi:hypothetical protein